MTIDYNNYLSYLSPNTCYILKLTLFQLNSDIQLIRCLKIEYNVNSTHQRFQPIGPK